MASTTANLQKFQQASTELENISVAMVTNHSKLTELMEQISAGWQGQAAQKYVQEFKTHSPELESMASIIDEASRSLDTIKASYTKAEGEAADTIRSLLGR